MESLTNTKLIPSPLSGHSDNLSSSNASPDRRAHGLYQTIVTPHAPHHVDVVILVVIASVGFVANIGVLLAIFASQRLRRASNAFLTHHCMLDLLKSVYCVAFAQSLVSDVDESWCGLLGGSYIVFVTSSAFNLLAMVMNEAYHFSDLTISIRDSRNCCCIIFGVFTIWFSSIIMNLGVAFIPRNPSYNRDESRCVFIMGVTENYVLQILWLLLISLSLVLTLIYLYKLHLDIKRVGYYRLSTLVRSTFQINPRASGCQETQDRDHIRWVQNVTRHKLYLISLLISSFLLFWYPLFLLALSDPSSASPRFIYKVLTVLAWSHSSLTPFLVILILNVDFFCCHVPMHVVIETSVSGDITCGTNETLEEVRELFTPSGSSADFALGSMRRGEATGGVGRSEWEEEAGGSGRNQRPPASTRQMSRSLNQLANNSHSYFSGSL